MSDPSWSYDSIASDFDRLMNRYDLDRRLWAVFDRLLAGTDLNGRKVLNAGCGTGFFTAAARGRGAEVVAVDIGTKLLEETRRKSGSFAVAADIAVLPFRDGSFDVVLSSECVEHTVDPERSVQELARLVRPGGYLVVTCPNRFWRWSCTVANALGLRPYHGLENWPRWGELRRWIEARSLTVEDHFGLHLFPFVVRFTHPLLKAADALGSTIGPVFVNQCIRARRPLAGETAA